MRRLIILLIRLKLGLKKYELFRFANQKSEENVYYFNNSTLMKASPMGKHGWFRRPSSVSLNHLLSDECEIVRVEEKTDAS